MQAGLQLEYTGTGSGKRYTIASKIKVVEAIKNGASYASITDQTGIRYSTLASWIGDYDIGMYSLENVTNVIRQPKRSLYVILQQAEQAATEANDRVQRIKTAIETIESEGLKVA